MSRAALLLLLVLLLPEAARAQTPDAGLLESVELGWGGISGAGAPTSVQVVLQHPGPQELAVEVVLRSGAQAVTEPLLLPAGARRRVWLALVLEGGEGLLQVRSGERVLASRQLSAPRSVTQAPRPILVLDGRPPPRRGGAEHHWGDTVLPLFAAGAELAPAEAACYRDFSAVYLRGVDPDAWTPEARAALLEHALQGGALVIAPSEGVGTTPALTLLPGGLPEREVEMAGRPVRELRLGLGRALVLPEDLVAASAGGGERALAVARALGEWCAALDPGRLAPPVWDELDALLLDGPGLPTSALLLGFLLVYVLLLGPAMAIFARRLQRRRLFAWVVGLVLAFTLLAPLVAGLVRAASGTAYVHLVQWVPLEGGPGLELGDVTVVSGGSARGELILSAPGELAATLHPADPTREQGWDGRVWGYLPVTPQAPRTRRGSEVRFSLAMSPWGRQSASTLALLPAPGRVRATLESGPQGVRAVIENLGPDPLVAAALMEAGKPLGPQAGCVPLGDLAPGSRHQVPLPRLRLRPIDPARERPWFQVVGAQAAFRAWGDVRAVPSPGDLAPRLLLVSRASPRVEVRGGRLSTQVSALRVDPVLPPNGAGRGYLGLAAVEQNGQLVVSEVAPGSPAAAAGVTAGDMIYQVDEAHVSNLANFRAQLRRRLAGERVELGIYSPGRGRQRSLELQLEPRSRLGPGGD